MSPHRKNQPTTAKTHTARDTQSPPDAVSERVFQINSDGILTFASTLPEDYTDSPFKDLSGHPIEQILPEDTARRFREGMANAKKLGETQRIRYQQQIDDRVHFFEARISPVVDGDFNVAVQQILAQSNTDDQENTRPTNFEALVARLPGAFYRCLYDENWSVIFISAGIEEFLGHPATDFFTPGGLSLLDVMYEPDLAYVRRLVDEATHRNAPFIIEYRMVHADGSLRWVNEQGQIIFDENGHPESIEGIIMDVTESYKLRETAAVKNAHFSSVGVFGAGIAHEINNALAIMMANLDYAVEELETVEQIAADDTLLQAPLRDINQSLEKLDLGMKRVQKIVHDLRSYSDSAGNMQTETVDVIRLIEWALHEVPGLQSRAQVIRNVPDKPVLMHGNQLGLIQVFTHLLSNAEKSFTSDKRAQNKVTISLKNIPNNAILIEIQDTGVGIDHDVLPRIFEPFFSTRPIGDGTGLGLFVCQGIVRSMDGEILISSTPQQGTTVQIILPTKVSLH